MSQSISGRESNEREDEKLQLKEVTTTKNGDKTYLDTASVILNENGFVDSDNPLDVTLSSIDSDNTLKVDQTDLQGNSTSYEQTEQTMLLQSILKQLKILNLHMNKITDEHIKKEDID